MKTLLAAAALTLITGTTLAQSTTAWLQEAKALEKSMDKNFFLPANGYYREHTAAAKNEKPVSYLWPICALIQADHELERAYGDTGRLQRRWTFVQRYYDPRPPAPGYASYPPEKGGGDRFYDDNQWIGIALMDAYKDHRKAEWLAGGELIYRFMMTAYDTASGGGLYWQEGKWTSKNTCSNGPGIILALQLHQATGKQAYLDTALLLYNWVNKYLRDEQGLYLDNISIPQRKVDQRRYSYNTGTMLQSNLYLYQATKKPEYLQEAKRIAAVGAKYFLQQGKFRDGYWFNAVLLRGYEHLASIDKNPAYLKQFAVCARTAIAQQRNADGLYTEKDHVADLTNQAGMLEILARLAYLDRKFQF